MELQRRACRGEPSSFTPGRRHIKEKNKEEDELRLYRPKRKVKHTHTKKKLSNYENRSPKKNVYIVVGLNYTRQRGTIFLCVKTHDTLIIFINTQPLHSPSLYYTLPVIVCTCESQTIVRTGLNIDRCISGRKQEPPRMICSFALTIISLSEMSALYKMPMIRHFKGKSLLHFCGRRWYCEYC